MSTHLALSIGSASFDQDFELLQQLRPHVGSCALDLALILQRGPSSIRRLADLDLEVLIDLNLHQTPDSMDATVAALSQTGARYVTLSAHSGPKSLEIALSRASREATGLLVAVTTVLTSVSDDDLQALGETRTSQELTLDLAKMAWALGFRAIVASPLETSAIRKELGSEAFLITPAIRCFSQDTNDHERFASPFAAVRNGSNMLVVGRPIRDAANPLEAARNIAAQIDDALDRPDC